MILILLAIVLSAAIFGAMFWFGENYDNISAVMVGLFGLIASGVASIVYAFAGWNFIAADYKANIINREYGTSYTQTEVFYASDVIDTVRELNRKRIEVNGNLMQEQEHSHKK